MNNTIGALEQEIGVSFENPSLLKRAVTHKSYLNENEEVKEHNERLEFLGDAVLELVITSFLFKELDAAPEGILTAARAEIVRTESLADVARKIDIESHLRLSKGEQKNNGSARNNILADTFEAIIGAIYLDQGLERTRQVLLDLLGEKITETTTNRDFIDAKSELQEIWQDQSQITPHYEVLNSEGPDHDKTFTVGVFAGKRLLAKGQGANKQSAEQEAAKQALEQI